MRPLKLVISGWGPYQGKVKINFEQYGTQNLFLITGPTGSGKTTIFDAVCFALYGSVSGKYREKNSLRSDFAESGTDTFVELHIVHKGKQYEIHRSPKYSRPKKRGDGYTIANETAFLKEEGKPPITSVNEVNRCIEQLMEMSYEQFKQIAMIAQGEFLDLIHTDSKERTKILRRLFRTELFHKIQEALENKAKKQYREWKELKNKADEASSLINTENEEILSLLSEESRDYKKISVKLQVELKKEKEHIEILESREAENRNALDRVLQELSEAKRQNEIIAQYEKISEELENLMKRQDEIKEKKEREKNALSAQKVFTQEQALKKVEKRRKIQEEKIVEIKSRRAALYEEHRKALEALGQCAELESLLEKKKEERMDLEKMLPIFQKAAQAKEKAEILAQECRRLKEKREEAQRESIKYKKKEEQIRKTIEKYKDTQKQLSDLTQQLWQTAQRIEKLEKAKELQQKILKSKNALETLKRNFLKIEEEKEKQKKEYEEKEKLYRHAIVGIVAGFVEEGKPCPVCGSVEHPNVAGLSEEVPDEKELEFLKKKAEEAEKICQASYNRIIEQKSVIKGFEDAYWKLIEELEIEEETLSDHLLREQEEEKRKEQSKIQIEGDQQQKKNLEEQLILVSEECNRLQKIEELQKEEEMQAALRHGEQMQTFRTLKEQLPSSVGGMKEIKAQLERRKEETGELEKKIRFLQRQEEESRTELERADAIRNENENIYSALETEEKAEKKLYEKSWKENGFQSEEEYRNVFLQPQELERLRKEIVEYEKSAQEKRGQKEGLKREAERGEKADLSKLEERRVSLENKISLIRNELEALKREYEVNRKALHSMKEKEKDMMELEGKYGVYSELAKISGGENKERLVFEQYVLTYYFEEILRAANLRMNSMTGGRFELLRVEEVADARTKNNLDLDVMDYYTGKRRSIKTLSGGESFKAALSLALGLSDTVQNYTGGIEIETLFIDEGFGSLDTESLDQALNTLIGLSGEKRLIGIISHVRELRDRIGNQIIVNKEPRGSSIVQISDSLE